MDSISDLMKNRSPQEPPQVRSLKDYVKNNHNESVNVEISHSGYIIVVPNAPLASVLRMEIPQIKVECSIDKKLFIRISG